MPNKKIYHIIDGFLFRWTNKIRKNNVSVVMGFLAIFFALCALYTILYLQSIYCPLNWNVPIWEPEVAIPAILTITGLVFTIIVLFTIVPKGTQTGDQFMYLLIDEIDSLKKEEEITIISPNINIGTITYKTLLTSLIKSIQNAANKKAKVSFITYSLESKYLETFIANDRIGSYAIFFEKGADHGCKMLWFLSILYDKHGAKKEEYEQTIKDLKLLLPYVFIVQPNTKILEQDIVGFISNSKFYIGKYYPDSSNAKQITVKGEIIDTSATVTMLKEHFIKEL